MHKIQPAWPQPHFCSGLGPSHDQSSSRRAVMPYFALPLSLVSSYYTRDLLRIRVYYKALHHTHLPKARSKALPFPCYQASIDKWMGRVQGPWAGRSRRQFYPRRNAAVYYETTRSLRWHNGRGSFGLCSGSDIPKQVVGEGATDSNMRHTWQACTAHGWVVKVVEDQE